MRLGRIFARHPLRVAVIFQGLIIPLALGLALVLGVAPWADLHWSMTALVVAAAATAPLVLGLGLSAHVAAGWFRELDALVRPTLVALFRDRRQGPIVLVSLLAGFGEELLFRGVLQVWLTDLIGVVLAVLLVAVAFGLVHYLSRMYFLFATGLGLYLGLLYEVTGNLLVVCLVHALYDWIAINYLLRRGSDPPA